MNANALMRRIVILGGGTAGWMAAAALAKALPRHAYQIQLIESADIGTVGVGEATVPHIRYFNQMLGLDEHEFMQHTQASFKLGIQLEGWGREDSCYINPFGVFGAPIKGVGFHHYWLRLKQLASAGQLNDTSEFSEYCTAVAAAQAGKFAFPGDTLAHLPNYSYAYHLDASAYAQLLKSRSLGWGVERIEDRVTQVELCPDSGQITRLLLARGAPVAGDLFIDCSGFGSRLLGDALGVGYENWSHWLPCDSALAMASGPLAKAPAYTRAIAKAAGWQWQIPLQHRTGNGLVYCSHHLDHDQAEQLLRASVKQQDAAAEGKARALRFVTGRRRQSWVKNCVALGLASGFLEPLESTSIYLIQVAIMKLLECFPHQADDALLAAEFNRDIAMEYERVRDFLVLHYHANQRDDSDFWRDCRTMTIPDSLAQKIRLFREQGQVERYTRGMFLEPSWLAVYFGQGIEPEACHPLAQQLPPEELQQLLARLRGTIQQAVEAMPEHQQQLRGLEIARNSRSAPLNLYGAVAG